MDIGSDMFIEVLKCKIHRATVTGADLNYQGSITIDKELMDLTGIITNEKVQIVDINNGERFDTYVIPGKRNSGIITLNGAAARLVQPGDKVIIMAYALMNNKDAMKFKPVVVFVDDENKVVEVKDYEHND